MTSVKILYTPVRIEVTNLETNFLSTSFRQFCPEDHYLLLFILA